MKVTKAKTAGFCFGVNRAVDMTTNLAKSGKKVATMGPLIHNHQAIEALEKLSVITMDSLDAPEGYEVVLRSHGVEKHVYEYFESRGIITHDAACPYVKKIHRLAEKTGKDGKTLLVAGDETHAEVKGIVSYTDGEYFVFNEPEQLEKWLAEKENAQRSSILVA